MKTPVLIITSLIACLLPWSLVLAAESVIVTFSEAGYEPADVTIETGTEVQFVNAGTDNFWPAVDLHPTHELYDGTSLLEHCDDGPASFDACKPIESGQTWSFVFTKPGTFPYHDHLWPHLQGSIIVSGEENDSWLSILSKAIRFIYESVIYTFYFSPPAQNIDIPSLTDGVDPVAEKFVTKLVETDPSWAIALLIEESSSSSEIYAQCHEILHEIGSAAYEQYGSFEAAATFKNDFCNSGYIHGVFEAYFQAVSDPLLGLEEACATYAETGREFDRWECRHGIGHGFMYYTGGDLEQSLTLCDKGFAAIQDASDCHNGVFMEVFNLEILAKEVDLVKQDNPMQICDDSSVGKNHCYQYIPTYLSQTLAMEYADMYEYCEAAPDRYKSSCKQGISSEAMKRSTDDPGKVLRFCELVSSTEDRTTCVIGAVSMYINQTGTLEAGEALCTEVAWPYNLACERVIETRAKEF